VTIQAQILELLQRLQSEFHMAIILITHDLGVVARICHRVLVMYAGKIVEEAKVDDLFRQPQHPYSLGLLESVARLDEAAGGDLQPIAGSPPDLTNLPPGCAFHPRCPFAELPRCQSIVPPLVPRPDYGKHACLFDITKKERKVPVEAV
jgi:oligopeptide/dipeptide ABC transporter ATP-binding protein